MERVNIDAILDDKDRDFVAEIVELLERNHLRAAFIMSWLVCIEGLRRKIQEASNYSEAAKQSWTEITNQEKAKMPADKWIITEAAKLNLISSVEKGSLNRLYEQRCIFAHPYEQTPTYNEVIVALEYAIDIVLSKPLQLGEDFAAKQLNLLTQEPALIDADYTSVITYANDMLEAMNLPAKLYFINKYMAWLNQIDNLSRQTIVAQRAIIIIRHMLLTMHISNTKISNFITKYKNIIGDVFAFPAEFKQIAANTRKYIVNLLIENGDKNINYLNVLYEEGLLDCEQVAKYKQLLRVASLSSILSYNLDIDLVFDVIISLLKSHDFNKQNAAISLLTKYSKQSLKSLSEEKLILLGRNILQSADRSNGYKSDSAAHMLSSISSEPEKVPLYVVKGIIFECFVNDEYKIRLKLDRLSEVTTLISNMSEDDRNSILSDIINFVSGNELKEDLIGTEPTPEELAIVVARIQKLDISIHWNEIRTILLSRYGIE